VAESSHRDARRSFFWHTVQGGADQLRFWWTARPVATWRRELDDIMVMLKDTPASNKRSEVISQWRSLRAADTIRDLVQTVRRAS
jgi:hypothetical protein